MNTVVMATYNEAETIGVLLDQLTDYRVIVVDDSSPDGTGALAAQYPQVRLIERPGKLGIASAYLTGFEAALAMGATYVVQMDAGGTHDPADVTRLLDVAYLSDAALVIGSRFVKRTEYRGWRTLLSLGAAWLMRRAGIGVKDATSGYRCWHASLLRSLDFNAVQARGFAFQLELLHQAAQRGAKIVEMPIDYRLTNSTLNRRMIWEAARTYARLVM